MLSVVIMFLIDEVSKKKERQVLVLCWLKDTVLYCQVRGSNFSLAPRWFFRRFAYRARVRLLCLQLWRGIGLSATLSTSNANQAEILKTNSRSSILLEFKSTRLISFHEFFSSALTKLRKVLAYVDCAWMPRPYEGKKRRVSRWYRGCVCPEYFFPRVSLGAATLFSSRAGRVQRRFVRRDFGLPQFVRWLVTTNVAPLQKRGFSPVTAATVAPVNSSIICGI